MYLLKSCYFKRHFNFIYVVSAQSWTRKRPNWPVLPLVCNKHGDERCAATNLDKNCKNAVVRVQKV